MSNHIDISVEEEVAPLEFMDVARLPMPSDNVAVAINVIPEGTQVKLLDGSVVRMSHTVLEGHRFAVKKIEKDNGLYSWRMQFGTALKDIYPGEYIMNERGLKALKVVDPNFKWPDTANFDDRIISYVLDEENFKPAPPMELVPGYENETFMGYKREGKRGVGTRNYVVVFSASSLCNSIVKITTEACQKEYRANAKDNMDGVVCCIHTEGSVETEPLNKDKVLRTLAGFLVHPNVGAAIVVYNKDDIINRVEIENSINSIGFDVSSLPIQWIPLEETTTNTSLLHQAITESIPKALSYNRTPQPVASLCLALQCGGSDAFSGVTANPLQGAIAEHVIHRGGSAILAETDELIGADAYILDKVKNIETARAFMQTQQHYEKTANVMGVSAQANPSGGNFYRGLYNIAIKSLGAAMKKSPNSRLEGVLKYGERIKENEAGYYFMDTPGNDIESVTGQVAGGCNIVMFSTGNGSITNFPFVPHTVKLLTTSRRYNRLSKDLDINAGKYLDGMTLPDLTLETYNYVLKIAQGQRSFGEKAQHSQIQIWRNWYCANDNDMNKLMNNTKPSGLPYEVQPIESKPLTYTALHVKNNTLYTGDNEYHRDQDMLVAQSGLVVFPTSLCSGQIANVISTCVKEIETKDIHNAFAKQCDENGTKSSYLDSKYSFNTALIHTEGCAEGYGASVLDGMKNYDRITIGHLLHPFTRSAFMIEHGCEKSLLSYFEIQLKNKYQVDMSCFGQGSVQKECGIENAIVHATNWILDTAKTLTKPEEVPNTPIEGMIFALLSNRTKFTDESITTLSNIIRHLVANKAIVVIPENDPILANSSFVQSVFTTSESLKSTILNGDQINTKKAGVHIMRMTGPNEYIETITSLAATGASMILTYSDSPLILPGHPFVPMLRLGSSDKRKNVCDILIKEGEDAIMKKMMNVLSRKEKTITTEKKLTDFQITRTMNGFSL